MRHALIFPLAALTLTALAGCGGGSNSPGGTGGGPATVSGFLISGGTTAATGGGGGGAPVSASSAVEGSAGVPVTLTGSHLTGTTRVNFGSVPATGLSVNSAGTELVCTVPNGTGTVPVTVLTPGGALSAGTYTYVPATTTTGYAPESQFGNTGTGTTGLLSYPQGLALDAAGDVFVVDGAGGAHLRRVVKYSSAGTFLAAFGDTGTTATGLLGGYSFSSSNGQYLGGNDIATDPAGNVYVADGANNRVVEYSNSGTYLATLGDTGTPATGQLSGDSDLATDPAGDVYVSNNGRIVKYSSAGTYLATLDATGGGHLRGPGFVGAVDNAGDLYLGDSEDILKLSSAGAYLANLTPYYSSVSLGLGYLGSFAVDGAGNVFAAASLQVVEFTVTGRNESFFGPTDLGVGEFVGGVAVDSADAVYIIDVNHVVKFTVQTITTPVSPSPVGTTTPGPVVSPVGTGITNAAVPKTR